MSSLLIAVGFFAFGALLGIAATVAFYTHYMATMNAAVVKRLLAESGYEIKDKRIVPIEQSATSVRPRPKPATLLVQ